MGCERPFQSLLTPPQVIFCGLLPQGQILSDLIAQGLTVREAAFFSKAIEKERRDGFIVTGGSRGVADEVTFHSLGPGTQRGADTDMGDTGKPFLLHQ